MSNIVIGKIKSHTSKNEISFEIPIDNVSLINIFSKNKEEEFKNSLIENWLVDWLSRYNYVVVERLGLTVRDNFPALSLFRKNKSVNDWTGITEANHGLKTIVDEVFHRRKLFGEEGVGNIIEYNTKSTIRLKRKIVIINSVNELSKIAKAAQVDDCIQEILHSSAAYGYTFLIITSDLIEDTKKIILNPEIKIQIDNEKVIFEKFHPLFNEIVKIDSKFFIDINYGSKSISMLNAQNHLKEHEKISMNKSKDFLSLKIGKNGAKDFYLNMGETSEVIHGFISGTVGSGKSTFITRVVLEAIKKYTFEQINIDLIDLKQSVDSDIFFRHPCRMITGTLGIKPKFDEINSLFDYYKNMVEERYETLRMAQCKNIGAFNAKISNKLSMPYKIVIIDEAHEIFKISESIMSNHRLTEKIQLLLQRSRAAGIHFIFASQSFKNSGFTDTTKEQIQLRLALKAGSSLESQVMVGDESAFKIQNSPSERRYYMVHNSLCGNHDSNSLILLDFLSEQEIEFELKRFEDLAYRVPIIDIEASLNKNHAYARVDESHNSNELLSLEEMESEWIVEKKAQASRFDEIIKQKNELNKKVNKNG